jgi:hypothetical protein
VTTKLSDCVSSISRLAHHDHIRFGFDNRGEALAEDWVIFDAENADLFAGRHDAAV